MKLPAKINKVHFHDLRMIKMSKPLNIAVVNDPMIVSFWGDMFLDARFIEVQCNRI
jgi:hypothetical protein